MGLNYLSNAEMIETSSRWLGPERAKFEAILEIAGLLPKVELAHQGLLALPKAASEPALVAESNEVLDGRQDHCMRAVYYLHRAYREYLLGQAVLDADEIQWAKASQQALLPRGMAGTRAGFIEEAGNAKVAEETLQKTTAAQHVIGKLRLTDTVTGQQVVDAWFAAAAALGAAVQAQSAQIKDSDPELGVKNLKARHSWISITRAVLAVLDHTSASPDLVAAIRGPIEDLEEKATARALARLKQKQPTA